MVRLLRATSFFCGCVGTAKLIVAISNCFGGNSPCKNSQLKLMMENNDIIELTFSTMFLIASNRTNAEEGFLETARERQVAAILCVSQGDCIITRTTALSHSLQVRRRTLFIEWVTLRPIRCEAMIKME